MKAITKRKIYTKIGDFLKKKCKYFEEKSTKINQDTFKYYVLTNKSFKYNHYALYFYRKALKTYE